MGTASLQVRASTVFALIQLAVRSLVSYRPLSTHVTHAHAHAPFFSQPLNSSTGSRHFTSFVGPPAEQLPAAKQHAFFTRLPTTYPLPDPTTPIGLPQQLELSCGIHQGTVRRPHHHQAADDTAAFAVVNVSLSGCLIAPNRSYAFAGKSQLVFSA